MNKEEIKDYLKRIDELELKLSGEDRETYQWVLFGYNECARLLEEKEQENQQLHNKIDKVIDVIHTQMKNNPSYKENLKIIEITLIKGSCKVCDLKDGDVDE